LDVIQKKNTSHVCRYLGNALFVYALDHTKRWYFSFYSRFILNVATGKEASTNTTTTILILIITSGSMITIGTL
jgi:hypothetical protein